MFVQLPSDSEPQMPGSVSHSFMSERDRERETEGVNEKERRTLKKELNKDHLIL